MNSENEEAGNPLAKLHGAIGAHRTVLALLFLHVARRSQHNTDAFVDGNLRLLLNHAHDYSYISEDPSDEATLLMSQIKHGHIEEMEKFCAEAAQFHQANRDA